MSRYSDRSTATNDDQMYQEVFEKRGVKKIEQYTTPTLKKLTDTQKDSIKYTKHTWAVGDRFWKLAHKHYGNKSLWWIIARFNNRPTEGHITVGEVIKIPENIILARELLS